MGPKARLRGASRHCQSPVCPQRRQTFRMCPPSLFGVLASSLYLLFFAVSLIPTASHASPAAWSSDTEPIVYPVQDQLDLELSIVENVPVGTLIGIIQANSSENEIVAQPPYLIVPITGGSPGQSSSSNGGGASSSGSSSGHGGRERSTRGVDSDLTIDQSTGEIRSAVVLDRERTSYYSFVAIPLSGANIRVTISVLDANDNFPSFPVRKVDLEFPENSKPRDVKRTLPPARDLDLGQYGTQRYEIVSGNYGGVFRLNSHREKDDVLYLDLQVNGVLDRESQASYTLVIEALDGGSPPLRGELVVNITILDQNDQEPIFSHSRYYASVPENATLNTSLLRVTATDADQGQNGAISYSLYSKESGPGSGSAFFGINDKSGWIFVTRPLDFEAQEMHELVVVAKDAGVQPLETSAFVSIRVTNVNDNVPTISLLYLTESQMPTIPENAKIGDLVARVSIHDPDSGDGQQQSGQGSSASSASSAATGAPGLSVSLSGSEGHFALTTQDSSVYLVTVTAPLDSEKKSKYSLTITATDHGSPPLNSTHNFVLEVLDINDNLPYFESPTFYASLPEGSQPGTSVFQMKAHDRDASSAISYRLLSEAQLFTIDSNNGLITTRTRLSREQARGPTMQLVVSASDGSSASATATLVVAISDADHREPALGFANDPLLQVTEDCCSAGDVVMMFRINISYGDFVVRYQLETTGHGSSSGSKTSDSSSDLLLDSETGLLTLARPFDYERKRDYKLNVTAAIYQRSQNNHHQRPGASGPGESGQGGTGARGGQGVFRPPVKIISQLFQVDILNVNDEAPVLLQTEYRKVIPENTEPDTFLLQIEARDPDDGDRKLTFQIPEHHASRQLFELNPFTGELRTKAHLDREVQAVHRIPVYVFDAGMKHMTPTEAVIILEDINENSPIFSVHSRNQVVRVPENILPGTIFHTVVASDRDLLLSSELSRPGVGLTYRILSGDPDGAFTIDAQRGEMATTGPLDRERQAAYELVVEASDATFSATANLTVELVDINDNVPLFTRDKYQATLDFSSRASAKLGDLHEVLQVKALDSDSANSVYYTINTTSSADAIYFNMDPVSGKITTSPAALIQAQRARLASGAGNPSKASSVSSTATTTFSFDVLALDVGSLYAAHSSRASVQVTFRNLATEVAARFRDYPYIMELEGHKSDFRVGAHVGRIAIDHLSSGSSLKIVDEQHGHRCSDFFHLDTKSGNLSVKRSLNSNMYECYVATATDGGGGGSTSTLLQILFLKGISSEMKARKARAFTLKVELSEATPPTSQLINLVARSRMPSLRSGLYEFHVGYSSMSRATEYFEVAPTSGLVSLKKPLDYETEPSSIELVVVAKKPSAPFDSPIYFNIVVTLLNANDNAPRFSQDQYVAFVKEGELRGTFVTHLSALDLDDLGSGSSQQGLIHAPLTYDGEVRPGSRLSYQILEGNHDNAFIIDPPGSGVVKTNSVLDREIRSRYVLRVVATDDGTPSDAAKPRLSSTCTLEINIIDINDNVPVFPPYQEISVSEDLDIGSVVSTLTANDVDTFPSLTYYKQRAESGQHDETDDMFDVELYTGKITLKAPLKLSSKSQYELNILASDSLHTVETQVVVKIKGGDAFTSPPPLAREHEYVVVNPSEDDCISSGGVNCEVARVAVSTINKNQGEKLPLRVIYRLVSDPSRSFYVDQLTGVVYNNQSLKLATNKLFPVTIVAGYSRAESVGSGGRGGSFINGLRSQASLLINVFKSEVRDDFDEFGHNTYNIEVPADKLGDVLLTFPLGSKYSYKIVDGNQANDFLLLRNNQLIKVKRSGVTEYKLEVEGTRKKGRGLSTKIVVSAKILAEGTDFYVPRVFTVKIPDSASIGREVTSIRADEDYLYNFKYFMSGGNELNHFRVEPSSGIITVNHQLDYEKNSYYKLVVSARKEDQSEVTIATVNVHVTHAKENSPKFPFSQPSLKASVDENMPVGTKVIRLIDSPNPSIKFTLAETSGSPAPLALDSKSGYLITTDIIDFESIDPPVYQLLLKSFDEEFPRRTSEVVLEIEVGSVDEYAPKFSPESYHFNVTASLGLPFLKVGRVMATDRDLGSDGKVQYHLRSSTPASALNKFRINPSNGLLSVSTLSMDDLPPKHSSIIVEASSGRENSLSALSVVQVHLRVADGSSGNRIYDGQIRPDDLTSPAVTPTTSSTIPGWILFLIVLLMLITVVLLFSIVVIRLYHQQQEAMMGRSHCSFGMNTLLRKRGQGGSALNLGPEGTPTYVHHETDHVLHGHHHHHPHHPHGGYIISPTAAVAPPPCYNEVTLASSNIEGHSASSGRGSAEDEDDVDEEIRMIIEGNDYYGDGLENDCNDRDSAVPTTTEYLARLGVANHNEDDVLDDVNENDDVVSEQNLKIVRPTQFSSVRSHRDRNVQKSRRHRSHSQRDSDDWPAICDSISTMLPTQEELCEAYNWDYLQNWGPQYQPLSSVFTEIAKLKGAEIGPRELNSANLYEANLSRLETASTISGSTTHSSHHHRQKQQNNHHQQNSSVSGSPLTSSNPLIQASSTSAFSPVRRPPSHGDVV